jgi:hypothetical protein
VAAVRKNLKRGSGSSLPPVLALGRQTVARGLETLERARIHELALKKSGQETTLESP